MDEVTLVTSDLQLILLSAISFFKTSKKYMRVPQLLFVWVICLIFVSFSSFSHQVKITTTQLRSISAFNAATASLRCTANEAQRHHNTN